MVEKKTLSFNVQAGKSSGIQNAGSLMDKAFEEDEPGFKV